MATINFLYRSTKSENELNIRLLFSHQKKAYSFGAKTKYRVTKRYWEKQHNSGGKDILLKNKRLEVKTELNKIETFILNAFNSTPIEKITKGWLQLQLDTYYNPPKIEVTFSNQLSVYAKHYIKCKEHELSSRSIMKYKTIIKKIEMMEDRRRQPILIHEINEGFKNEFIEYYNDNNYSINTMHKELSFIKTFCKHARNNGLETSHQLDGLKLPKQKIEKIYLTFEELEKIENQNISSLALQNARDWLIISCYCGQRVSDFMRFTKEMIRIEDGEKLIEFTQRKTNKIISLALHPKVLHILNKNNGDFPNKISDQRYNEYIKEVCKISGLTNKIFGSKQVETKPKSKIYRKTEGYYPKYELITSHIGRRSFATNFYGNIPTPLLINATGHSSEFLFRAYLGKTQTQQAKELAKFWKK